MMTPQQRVDQVIKVEGDYVNNPADRGGPTRYGITQKTARAHGYAGDMAKLPIELARAIYLAEYWTGPRFDLVASIAPHVAGELFDTGVNMGTGSATKILQRALNAIDAAGLDVDGGMSPAGATLKALAKFIQHRAAQDGEAVLVELMNDIQGERYTELVEHDASQGAFIFGQIRNRVLDRSASA